MAARVNALVRHAGMQKCQRDRRFARTLLELYKDLPLRKPLTLRNAQKKTSPVTVGVFRRGENAPWRLLSS